MLRLWSVVLVSNLLGTAAFAGTVCYAGIFSGEVREAFAEIGAAALAGGFVSHFVRAIFSGWFGFLVPVGLGNMCGGVALVAALSYAQISADARR